ncbi:MAG: phosphate signaling complex protein PhoU [Candidatus Zixiibacteriota bacterium]
MSVHLRKEIDRLKKQILTLSAAVEESVQKAVKAMAERDDRLAQRVIDQDIDIDEMEVEVEEECLKILALHQPVAIDLRFIIAVLKINNDLERIGDLAVNIAERALFLSRQEPVPMPFDFPTMSALAQSMLHRSLDALVNMNSTLASEVCLADDDLDAMNREMYSRVHDGILANPDRIDCFIQLLATSRQLERIGDHATNIAQDVIYMIEGKIVRHRMGEYASGK